MRDDSILERNLLSLSLHNKNLAGELSRTELSDDVSFKKSRNNFIVPVIYHNNRNYSLHSLFDPVKEGSRYSASITGGGYIVVFGFGAGYHLRELLKRDDINSILVIDRDMPLFKSVLSVIDFSDIFSDSRLSVVIDKDAGFIEEFLPTNYLPAITGDFKTLSLRSRVESEKEYFQNIFRTIKIVLGTLSDDYTVQTWFGMKWFTNSIANLSAAEKSYSVVRPHKNIIIAAAGPSIEIQIDYLKTLKKSSFLISTDTALASLFKNSIIPDLVISIDCQQITYHHFMAGLPSDVPLVLDLASPPILARRFSNTIFFTSGHPFSEYINRNWRRFPRVDTSGGNVTHAAISLANKLGADKIHIFGADFSYPEGKSYARGTYIYPYFNSRGIKTQPQETSFYNFLYRNENINMIKTDYGYRYCTRPMLSYKERLEAFSRNVSSNIIPVEGLGEEINVPPVRRLKNEPEFFSAGAYKENWRSFLHNYRKRLENLTVPDSSPVNYFSSLDYTDKDAWTTLFPIAAALRQQYKDTEIKPSLLLNHVRTWALEKIDQYIIPA